MILNSLNAFKHSTDPVRGVKGQSGLDPVFLLVLFGEKHKQEGHEWMRIPKKNEIGKFLTHPGGHRNTVIISKHSGIL